MLLAEELDCDWSKVTFEFASVNRNIREKKIYGDMYSNGSRSIKESQKPVRSPWISNGGPFGWKIAEVPGVGHDSAGMFASNQAYEALR